MTRVAAEASIMVMTSEVVLKCNILVCGQRIELTAVCLSALCWLCRNVDEFCNPFSCVY